MLAWIIGWLLEISKVYQSHYFNIGVDNKFADYINYNPDDCYNFLNQNKIYVIKLYFSLRDLIC